jgi:hypothetical protein
LPKNGAKSMSPETRAPIASKAPKVLPSEKSISAYRAYILKSEKI